MPSSSGSKAAVRRARARARDGAAFVTIEIAQTAPGRFAVRGELDFTTAREAHAAGVAVLGASAANAWLVDCSGVARANSAGLAVLLDWLAHAHRAGKGLRYENLPADLIAIAGISEVQELLEAGV